MDARTPIDIQRWQTPLYYSVSGHTLQTQNLKRTAMTPVPFVQQTPSLRAALTPAHRAGV